MRATPVIFNAPMASDDADILRACGLPIFFALPEGAAGLRLPENRHGQSVRVFARSLTVMQKEAIAASALTGNAWRLASDEGPYLDGFDAAPCPLAFLSTGMAASYMTELLALAKERGILVRDVALVQDNFYTMEGSALRGTMTGGALPVELEVRLRSEAATEVLQTLAGDAVEASPINGLMRGAHASLFSARRNGTTVALGAVRSIAPLAEPDPRETLARRVPASARLDRALVERAAAAAAVEGIAGGAHSSLKDAQSRTLHLRAMCTVRPDGVKEIEQHLYSPLGSTFRFLCDEAESRGGRGTAPDAASYMAAGIAFCFMTQLGRYAKIAKRNLHQYNVIQDVHFSLGGASGRTGVPGQADAVETHVYLTSADDDGFARKVVEMGEQTCFLHAFCRTDLAPKVRVTRL